MRWYPSKIDPWLAVVLAFGPLVCIAAGITLVVAGEPWWLAAAPLVLVAGIYVGLVFPMRYAVADDAIVVRHGLVRQRIPLKDITEVRPTRNPLSSPALSLDRLLISFGTGWSKQAMISPADRDAFLDELAGRAGFVRDGDRLHRRGPASGSTRRT